MILSSLFFSLTLWRAHAHIVMEGRCLRRTGPFSIGRSRTELTAIGADRTLGVDISDFGPRAAMVCAQVLGAARPHDEAFARGMVEGTHLRTVPEFFGPDGTHHHGSVGIKSLSTDRLVLHASDLQSDQWHGELVLTGGYFAFPRFRVVGLNQTMREHLALITRFLEPDHQRTRFKFFAFGKLGPEGIDFHVDSITLVIGTRGLTMITGEVAPVRHGYAITTVTGRSLRLLEGPPLPLPLGTLTALPRNLTPRTETVIGFMSDPNTLDVFTRP